MIAITRNKRFDVDRYLDEHGQIRAVETDNVVPMPRPRRWFLRICDWQRRFELACDHIDNRLDRWLDRRDWYRVHQWIGTLGGLLLFFVACGLIWKLLDAWLAGRVNFGGN